MNGERWGWSQYDEYQDEEFVMTLDGAGYPSHFSAQQAAQSAWAEVAEMLGAELLSPAYLVWDEDTRMAEATYDNCYGDGSVRTKLKVVFRVFRFA